MQLLRTYSNGDDITKEYNSIEERKGDTNDEELDDYIYVNGEQ